MSEFFLLCFEVMSSRFPRFDLDRDSLDDLQAGRFERREFFRVVGYYANLAQAEIEQYLGTLLVVAGIYLKPQFLIRLDGVRTLILQGVGPDLVNNPYTPAFLLLVDYRSTALGFDHFHGFMQLGAAVALDRTEDVAGQTLRMDPDERGDLRAELALIKNDKLFITRQRAITGYLKLTTLCGQISSCYFLNRSAAFFGRALVIIFPLVQHLSIKTDQ